MVFQWMQMKAKWKKTNVGLGYKCFQLIFRTTIHHFNVRVYSKWAHLARVPFFPPLCRIQFQMNFMQRHFGFIGELKFQLGDCMRSLRKYFESLCKNGKIIIICLITIANSFRPTKTSMEARHKVVALFSIWILLSPSNTIIHNTVFCSHRFPHFKPPSTQKQTRQKCFPYLVFFFYSFFLSLCFYLFSSPIHIFDVFYVVVVVNVLFSSRFCVGFGFSTLTYAAFNSRNCDK